MSNSPTLSNLSSCQVCLLSGAPLEEEGQSFLDDLGLTSFKKTPHAYRDIWQELSRLIDHPPLTHSAVVCAAFQSHSILHLDQPQRRTTHTFRAKTLALPPRYPLFEHSTCAVLCAVWCDHARVIRDRKPTEGF